MGSKVPSEQRTQIMSVNAYEILGSDKQIERQSCTGWKDSNWPETSAIRWEFACIGWFVRTWSSLWWPSLWCPVKSNPKPKMQRQQTGLCIRLVGGTTTDCTWRSSRSWGSSMSTDRWEKSNQSMMDTMEISRRRWITPRKFGFIELDCALIQASSADVGANWLPKDLNSPFMIDWHSLRSTDSSLPAAVNLFAWNWQVGRYSRTLKTTKRCTKQITP